MVVTEAEALKVLDILETYRGKHQNTILYHIAKHMDCGTRRAGNLLHHLVRKDLARIEGFKVYPGGKQ